MVFTAAPAYIFSAFRSAAPACLFGEARIASRLKETCLVGRSIVYRFILPNFSDQEKAQKGARAVILHFFWSMLG